MYRSISRLKVLEWTAVTTDRLGRVAGATCSARHCRHAAGGHTPFGRAAQPDEIAPSYVFFAAAQLSSYYSGEVLAPIGGETLPG